MKNAFLLIQLACFSISSYAQTPRATIIEHFTNTVCVICANNNPNLWTNLASNPDVIHVSYHPSSPYPSCSFNQVDPQGNDTRVQYYNQYGSTPKAMINGQDFVSSSNFGNSTLFDSYDGLTSPFAISANLAAQGDDLLILFVTFSTTEDHNLDNLEFYICLSEETVNYSAPNGEAVHHNVFRESIFGNDPQEIDLPQNAGGSQNLTFASDIYVDDPPFDLDKLSATVIIQDSATKEIYQAFRSETGYTVLNSTEEFLNKSVQIYPNPVRDNLHIESDQRIEIRILDIQGKEIKAEELNGLSTIDMSTVKAGTYLVEMRIDEAVRIEKIIKY